MNETFGQRFSRLRKAKGLTQSEIAQKVNVSDQAVSKWENDINMPDIGLFVALSDILGVSTDVLLGKAEESRAVLVPDQERSNIDALMLRLIVNTKDGDKVRCNLPLKLIKICLDAGLSSPEITGNSSISSAMSAIDFRQIYAMVESGLIGEIVSVDTAGGDVVRVVVE